MGQFINSPPNLQPVIITEDGGGLVESYQSAAARYRVENRRVEIRGSCRSACTMALSVPNVCVGPRAVVKWHMAYDRDTKEVRRDITDQMVAAMPPRIRDRIEGRIQVKYNPEATLDYVELRNLGVKDCNSVASHSVAKDRAIEPSDLRIKLAPFLPSFSLSGISRWLKGTGAK